MVEGGRVKGFKNFVDEVVGGGRVEMKFPAQSGTNEGSERLGGGLVFQDFGGKLGGVLGILRLGHGEGWQRGES